MSTASSNRFFAQKSRPLVLGHRGAPWLHQENSLAGMRRALELGADGVEFDVFLTKDEKVVVFHDDDMERLTGVKGRVIDKTWDEISKLRLKRTVPMGKNAKGEDVVLTFEREEPIPLLEEVLSELKGKCAIDCELKPAIPNRSERAVGAAAAEIIDRIGLADQVVITSIDFFKLHAAEKARPALHSAFAYDDNALDAIEGFLRFYPGIPSSTAKKPGALSVEAILNWLLEINAIGRFIGSTAVIAEHTLIDDDTIERFHQRDMVVGAYTMFPLDTSSVKHPQPDDVEAARARELAALKVDWFETDDPTKLLRALEG